MKPKMIFLGAGFVILLMVSGCYTVIRVPVQKAEVGTTETVADSEDSDYVDDEESDQVRENDRIYYGYGPYVEFDLFGDSPYWWRHPMSHWGWNTGWWDPWDSYWSPYGYGYAGWSWYPSWYHRNYWGYHHDPFYSYWGGHYWGGHYASAEMKKRPFIRDERHDGTLGGPSVGASSSSGHGLAKPNSSGSETLRGAGDRRIRKTDTAATSGSGSGAATERRVRRTDGERAKTQADKPASDSGRRERRDNSQPSQPSSYNPPPAQTPSSSPSPRSSSSSGSSGSSSSSGSSGGRRSRN